MERILVSMDGRHGAWEAWSRATSLAKRIDARVYALLVLPAAEPSGKGSGGNADKVKKRLELLIELAKSEGLRIDYFISEGSYEDEVVRFADQNKVTLLVTESSEGENRHADKESAPSRRIRHRVSCRVEVVSPRKNQQPSVGEGNENEYSTVPVSANRRK
jgi:nucleotide-binding universal stress UspA family protein